MTFLCALPMHISYRCVCVHVFFCMNIYVREREIEGGHCPSAFNHYSHMLTLLSANIQKSFFLFLWCLKKENNTSLHISASPCKWNTYIRHHCGLHKCLKVINISSSVRLMCLVIGYLCCGLPLSKPPLHFGICVCVCMYSICSGKKKKLWSIWNYPHSFIN